MWILCVAISLSFRHFFALVLLCFWFGAVRCLAVYVHSKKYTWYIHINSTSIRDCTCPNRVQSLNINAFIYTEGERQTHRHTYARILCEAQREKDWTNKQTVTKSKTHRKWFYFRFDSFCFMLLPYWIHTFAIAPSRHRHILFGSEKHALKMCLYALLLLLLLFTSFLH